MAGRQIDSLPHTCGTKQALKVFAQDDGKVDGWCFNCFKFVPDPYGDGRTVKDLPPKREKTPEDIAEEIAEITGYQTLDVAKRKLRGKTLKEFEAKVSVSEQDGTTPTAIYWPVKRGDQLTGYQVKILNPPTNMSKAYNVGEVKNCDLLNWHNAKRSGAKRIIITEGPEDMASVYQICSMESPKEDNGSPKYMPAVASLPFGAGSAKHFLQKHSEELRKLFKEVVLCFDNDEAGQRALKEAVLVLPEALAVTLPYKDANECILEGAVKAAYKALSFGAYSPKNTAIVKGFQVHDLAKQPAKFGELSWPWAKLNEDMRGIRLGETTYLGAG